LKLAESISYTDPIFPEHISEKLKEIIQKMMSKDPNKRPKASQLINEYFDGKRIC
jgi:serine/threonine protein kinase